MVKNIATNFGCGIFGHSFQLLLLVCGCIGIGHWHKWNFMKCMGNFPMSHSKTSHLQCLGLGREGVTPEKVCKSEVYFLSAFGTSIMV